MDDIEPEITDHLESEKYYSNCLRCGKEMYRYDLYAHNNKYLRCKSCNKKKFYWNVILYLWFLLGIPISYFLFSNILPEYIIRFILEYVLLGYLLIGGFWCLGLVIIEKKIWKYSF